MPHMPDSHHADHDLELVAAFAAGDATGADLETATSLVAACAECAALHHDLRAIAAALPALPAPVRPRDFRLSPDQAASLRPRGLRALLAAFASPRLSFATPLGSGLAALGIIGILVASGGLPTGGATSTAVDDANRTTLQAPAEAGAAAASPAPAASAAPAAQLADPSAVLKSAPDGAAAAGQSAPEVLPAPTAAPADPDLLLVAAVVLLFLGTALVAARLVSTRLARAP
jgi:hypothetical protein